MGFQALTAHGALIVEGAGGDEPYEYDDDIPMLISDFFAPEDEAMEAGLVANPFKWSGEPSAVLVNGQSGNASFTDATDNSCRPHVISVEPGKTYRLRFISVTALSFAILGIENHDNLTLIEADGQYTRPAETDHIQLGSGQRFSALLRTKNEDELGVDGNDTYWIRYETRDRPTMVAGYALLQYDMSSCNRSRSDPPSELPAEPPVALSRDAAEYTRWMEYSLEPLQDAEAFPKASEVTRTVYIRVNQHVMDGFYNGSVNGRLIWE